MNLTNYFKFSQININPHILAKMNFEIKTFWKHACVSLSGWHLFENGETLLFEIYFTQAPSSF